MNAFAEALKRLTNRVAFSPDQLPIVILKLPVARQNIADETKDEILPGQKKLARRSYSIIPGWLLWVGVDRFY